jgi:hypothetical protein
MTTDSAYPPDTEAQYAELQGQTRAAWRQLTEKRRASAIQTLEFIKRIDGARFHFHEAHPISEVSPRLNGLLRDMVGSADLIYGTSAQLLARRSADRLQGLLDEPDRFAKLNFGVDVAERDVDLPKYFISTKAFGRVDNGSATVIIGPKGSGKTAILKELQVKRGSANTIVITPEVFATSMLKQVIEGNKGVWDEDQAFVSTWIFTILVEVFKRIAANPKGVPAQTLKSLKTFLRDNAKYEEVDLFTRFVGYLKRIEGVKVGTYELALKTRMLQELYSLAPLYELVPRLRGAGGEVLIMLDELDQGWDNSDHANRFIGSLLKAAIKIQSLGLKAQVVTFLRLEIFELIKGQLDQLDKLRSSIETIRWSDGELADLVVRRVAHSLSFAESRTGFELDIATSLFEGQYGRMNGFEYLLSRTSLRPREVLQFLKHAHQLAVDSGFRKITPEVLIKAEEEFSNWKIEHMQSEYSHIYPRLADIIWAFRAKGPMLSHADIAATLTHVRDRYGEDLPAWAKCDANSLIQTLFSVEFLGVPRPTPAKNRSGLIADYEFAFERRNANIRAAESFLVQPATWAALEIPAA